MAVRVGLIGAGRMGATLAHHLAFTATEADFVAVADSTSGKAAELAFRYHVSDSYVNYHDLLQRTDIDAVVIATPTSSHVEVVKAAAAAGKHIFCEKPLSLTLDGCDDAITAVAEADVKLQLGFMRRFDPGYAAAKEKIEAGVIGTPVMFKSTARDPRRTSLEFARRDNSGGLIFDMGVHDFDTARWLMGSEIVRVSSQGSCLVFPELAEVGDIDNAVVNLLFASGAVGNVDLSRNAVYGYDIRSEVLGSEGSLWIGRIQQTPLLVLTRNGVTHDTMPYFTERYAEAYAGEIAAFIDCVQHDHLPVVSGPDGRAATAIGIAATRSLDEGRPQEVGS